MGVVFMFLCEYFGMPKEGGVVWYIGGGGVIVRLELGKIVHYVNDKDSQVCKNILQGGRGPGCRREGLLGPGLVSLFVVSLPRIRNYAQIL